MMAKGSSRLSAMDVTLNGVSKLGSQLNSEKEGCKYRFTPPSSGLTITAFSTVQFSLIHRKVLGSAYYAAGQSQPRISQLGIERTRLSTGTEKNPLEE